MWTCICFSFLSPASTALFFFIVQVITTDPRDYWSVERAAALTSVWTQTLRLVILLFSQNYIFFLMITWIWCEPTISSLIRLLITPLIIWTSVGESTCQWDLLLLHHLHSLLHYYWSHECPPADSVWVVFAALDDLLYNWSYKWLLLLLITITTPCRSLLCFSDSCLSFLKLSKCIGYHSDCRSGDLFAEK